MVRSVRFGLAAVAVAGMLAACTTPPATPQAMMAADPPIKPNWVVKHAVGIGDVAEASGGKVVTAASFQQALEQSLAAAGYLAHGPKPRYRLNATLQNLDQPPFTLTGDVNVKSTVLYRLMGPGTNAQYSVTTSGAATFDESAVFGKRLQLASERALQANIEMLLAKLQKF